MARDLGARLLILALLVTLAAGVWWYEGRLNGLGGDSGPAEVVVLVPPAQARWVRDQGARFSAENAAQYHVTVLVRAPDAALRQILAGQVRPAACGADDPAWIRRLIAAWAAGHKGAHIAATDDADDYGVYFQSPHVREAAGPGRRPTPTTESDALAAAATDAGLRVTYPRTPVTARRCVATLSAPWVTGDQRDGAQAFLKFLATRSAIQDGLRDHWRPVRGDDRLTLAPELRRYAGQGFREDYYRPHPSRRGSPHPARRGSPHPARGGSPHPARRGSPHPARRGSPPSPKSGRGLRSRSGGGLSCLTLSQARNERSWERAG